VGTLIYARTRIPLFADRWSLPLLLAVFAPLMILPNVGFNEWGHSFWIMEERFGAPLHMGFVVLGWVASLSFFSVVLQATPRFHELTRKLVFPG
jgi:methane/ammonia monooxygenase subunit C